MAKKVFSDYLDELNYQKNVWNRKASLRALYKIWYSKIISELSPLRPVIELGAGCGNFKAFFPESISTDMIKCGSHIDEIVDAMNIPYQNNTIGNFVMIDCLHHLPRPMKFIGAAEKALRPGGRIILFEPACTVWSRFVFSKFHHEDLNLDQDIFSEHETAVPDNKGLLFNNLAIATIMFIRNRRKFESLFPDLEIVKIEFSDCLIYPATGGFGYFNFVPAFMLKSLWTLESLLLRPFADMTSMRICIVLQKKGTDPK